MENENEQECDEDDITTEPLIKLENEDTHTLSQCTREKHAGDCGSVEGEEFEPDVCPAVLSRNGSSSHTQVIDGRLFFNTASLNADTCPIDSALETCKIDSSMLVRLFFQF